MNKLFYLLAILLFLSSCSLDTKSGLWTKSEKLDSENKNLEVKIFEENEIYEKEFNTGIKIILYLVQDNEEKTAVPILF